MDTDWKGRNEQNTRPQGGSELFSAALGPRVPDKLWPKFKGITALHTYYTTPKHKFNFVLTNVEGTEILKFYPCMHYTTGKSRI